MVPESPLESFVKKGFIKILTQFLVDSENQIVGKKPIEKAYPLKRKIPPKRDLKCLSSEVIKSDVFLRDTEVIQQLKNSCIHQRWSTKVIFNLIWLRVIF